MISQTTINSQSMLNRWSQMYIDSEKRNPERKTTRDARSLAQPLALGKRISYLAAVALGAWLVLAGPSAAFHDSALDPQSKQVLAWHLQRARHMCSSGDQQACALAPQVQAFGNMLAQMQQACARGDKGTCQAAAQAQQQLSSLMEQANADGMDQPSGGMAPSSMGLGDGGMMPRGGMGPQDREDISPPRGISPERMGPEARKPAGSGELKTDALPPAAERTVKLGSLTVPLGPEGDGNFTIQTRGKQVVFSNPDNPKALSFRFSKPEHASPRVISAKVSTDVIPVEGRMVGTGIVYAFRGSSHDNSSYYAILLTGDGAVAIERRTLEGGIRQLARISNPGIAPAGRPNVLTVTEESRQGKPHFAVAINGKSVGSFGGGTVGPGGRVGIVYSGIGNHGFADLEIGTAE